MSHPTSTLSKFISLSTLGLLTGSSLTLSLLTTPTLLALPTLSSANSALHNLSSRAHSLQRVLSQTSLVALLAAWTLSPREARHPYLLWTALPIVGIAGWEIWGGGNSSRNIRSSARKAKGQSREYTSGRSTGFGSGSEDEDGWRRLEEAEAASASASAPGSASVASPVGEDELINGESVRDGLLAFKRETLIKSAAYGFSFVLGLVGIWGDGY